MHSEEHRVSSVASTISGVQETPNAAGGDSGGGAVEACGGCRYFRRLADQATQGVCRRHPPVWRVDASVSEWPRVGDRDWCGEFALPKEPAR